MQKPKENVKATPISSTGNVLAIHDNTGNFHVAYTNQGLFAKPNNNLSSKVGQEILFPSLGNSAPVNLSTGIVGEKTPDLAPYGTAMNITEKDNVLKSCMNLLKNKDDPFKESTIKIEVKGPESSEGGNKIRITRQYIASQARVLESVFEDGSAFMPIIAFKGEYKNELNRDIDGEAIDGTITMMPDMATTRMIPKHVNGIYEILHEPKTNDIPKPNYRVEITDVVAKTNQRVYDKRTTRWFLTSKDQTYARVLQNADGTTTIELGLKYSPGFKDSNEKFVPLINKGKFTVTIEVDPHRI